MVSVLILSHFLDISSSLRQKSDYIIVFWNQLMKKGVVWQQNNFSKFNQIILFTCSWDIFMYIYSNSLPENYFY